jgi:hypothetical protein
MFIQPAPPTSDIDLPIPAGQLISIGSTGNEPTTVQLQTAYPGQSWIYTTIGSLFNAAKTFGPYTQDRVMRISSRNAQVEYSIGAQPQLRSFPALVIGNLEAISLVEPAATFITLTYDDDSGNVRLNSAGAHGLTAAVAVGEDVYVTWTGGTGTNGFYEVTDLDTDTTGTAVTVDLPYIDSTVTISIAAPGVVTWTNHGLSANDTIRFTTTGALPTGLSAGTTYYVKTVLSDNTFTVSASSGGTAITTSGTQSGTQTALVWYGTAVVAVANTAVTLASVTVPGWSMGVGGGMEIDALYTLTESATAKNIGMTYGGGVLMAVSAANNESACAQKLMCNRGSSQIVSNAVNQVGHGLSTGANVFLTVDATQDQTFAFTAQPAAANNVVILEAFKLHISF